MGLFIVVVFVKTISGPIRKIEEICPRKTIWVKLSDIFCSCTEFVILHQPLVIAYAQSWLMIWQKISIAFATLTNLHNRVISILKYILIFMLMHFHDNLWIISSIFDRCSMLQQTQSRPNHTSYRNFHFNIFVANALSDNIGFKKSASNFRKKLGRFLVLNIKNLGSG